MNHLRDKYKKWGIERSILTCYFSIWCQECRIVGVFFFYCQVLVSNNTLVQYSKTQRYGSFVSIEKLFSSSLFVVFQVFQQRTFLPSFLKLATDQIQILRYDLINPTVWILESRERGGG